MTAVSCNNYYFKILPESFCKGPIKKPWIEPEYALFDAEIGSEVSAFRGYLEVEYEKDNRGDEIIKISKYLSDCSKKLLFFGKCKDSERLDYWIRNGFNIRTKDFNFYFLLIQALEKHQEKMIEAGLQNQDQGEFLYEPFILNSSPIILVSPMGTGKTLFAIWLALRIQNGIPLVENNEKIYNNEHYKAKVLYLAFEGNQNELRKKIEAIKNYYEINEKVFFKGQNLENFMLLFFNFPFYNKAVRRLIRKTISTYRPNLIIFDSITSALMSKDELRQAEYIFSYIKNVLEPRGIASLLLMHPSKQDLKEDNPMPKGSILYMAYPRIVWHLSQTGEFFDGFELQLKSIKDNLGLKKNSYKFEVHFYEDSCDFRLVEIIDENAKNRKVVDLCLEYLQIHEKATISDIAEYYKLNYDAVRKTLNRLVTKGFVIRLSRGTYSLNKEEEEKEKKKEPTIIEGNPDDIPF